MIDCKICGEKTHIIKKHLTEKHEGLSVEDYKEKFGEDTPLLSEVAKKKIEERRKEVKSRQVNVQESAEPLEGGEKQPMHKLFGLGNIKKAKTANGSPIMINVLDRNECKNPETIPEFDSSYVFNVDVLKNCLMGLELQIPTYIWGHAGTGKSTLWEAICAATNRALHRIQHTVNTEESHIVGQYVVRHVTCPASNELRAKTEWEPGPLMIAMMNGDVYMADEYDRSYPSVLSVYQAILEGKPLYTKEAPPEYRLIKPHPNFRFVATGNTNGSGDETGLYQSTVIQDAATFERFGIVEKLDYMSASQEKAIIRAKAGVAEADADKLVQFAALIRRSFPNEVSLTIGPRVLINIGNIGMRRRDLIEGVKVAYSNRLPEAEAEAALSIAQRVLS